MQIGDIVLTTEIPDRCVYAVNLMACAADNVLRAKLLMLNITPEQVEDPVFAAWIQDQFQVFADAGGVPVSSVVVAYRFDL